MSEDVLKITITAAGAQAAAEMQKVAQSLSSVSKEATNVKTTHASAAKEVENLGGQFDNLAKHVAYMATGFQSFRAIFAGGVAGFGLYEIIAQTTQWDQALQNLSFQLNGNVVAASKWMALGQAFNVDATQLSTAFRTLSKDVENNAPVLRNMGIAIEDNHGKLLSMDQILTNVHEHLLQHADATNQAGEMALLFGRNTGNMTSLMMAQDTTWKAIIDDATKLGLIIDGKTLLSFRAMEADMNRTGASFQALTLAIGHGLLPALDAAGQAISGFIISHLDQLKAAIMNVVSFIIGFFEAFTGGTFQVSALATAIASSATPAVNDFGTAAGGAATANKALTDALNDQIKAIDLQIKGLQEATQLENYADSMRKLQEKATADKKKVDLDYSTYQQDLLLGNQAQAMTVLDSLQTAQQTSADNQLEIQKAQDDETRRLRINDLNDEKATLQARIAAIQDAAAKGVGAIGSAMAGVPGIMGNAGTAGGKAFGAAVSAQAESAGKKFGDELKKHDWAALGSQIALSILSGINSAFSKWFLKSLFGDKAVDSQGHIDWRQILLGDNFKFTGTAGSNTSPLPDSSGALVGGQQPGGLLGGQLPGGYAMGGIVPGPAGMPRLAVVHGGERYSGSPGSAAAAANNGATNVSVGPFYIGSVDSSQRIDEVRRVVRQEVATVFAR